MKAPSLFVSLLFVAVALAAVVFADADAIGAMFSAAVGFVTSVWRLWEEYREPVDVHTMDRELSRGAFSRVFWR